MKFLLQQLPVKWRIVAVLLLGMIIGLVLFLVHISKFFSYLSNSPNTCMNCHIMGPQYATWYHSAHRENATCVDCHVPQDNIFKTYFFKGKDGSRHSAIFTLGTYQQAIFIKEEGANAVQNNCKRCHAELLQGSARQPRAMLEAVAMGEGRKCWECHKEVPHGKVRSLSSAPFARVPTTKSMIPDWIKEMLEKEKKK